MVTSNLHQFEIHDSDVNFKLMKVTHDQNVLCFHSTMMKVKNVFINILFCCCILFCSLESHMGVFWLHCNTTYISRQLIWKKYLHHYIPLNSVTWAPGGFF